MIEVVVALIMYLDGSMIEHTYKNKNTYTKNIIYTHIH